MRKRGWGRRSAPRLLDRVGDFKPLGLKDIRSLDAIEGAPEGLELGVGLLDGARSTAVVVSSHDGLDLLGWAWVAAFRGGDPEILSSALVVAPVIGQNTRAAAAAAAQRGPALSLVAMPSLADGKDAVFDLERYPENGAGGEIDGAATLFDRVVRVLDGAAALTGRGAMRSAGANQVLYLCGERIAWVSQQGDGVSVNMLLPESREIRINEANISRWGVELPDVILKLAQEDRLLEGEAAQRAEVVDQIAVAVGARVAARWLPWNEEGADPIDWVGVDGSGRPLIGAVRSKVELGHVPGLIAGCLRLQSELDFWAPGASGIPRLVLSCEDIAADAQQILTVLSGEGDPARLMSTTTVTVRHERSSGASRAERDRRDSRGRSDRVRLERGDRSESGDRPGRGDRSESGDRPGRGDRSESGDRSARGDRSESGDRPGRGDRSESGDRPGRGDRSEIADATERSADGDRGESAELDDRAGRPRRRSRRRRRGRSDETSRPEESGEELAVAMLDADAAKGDGGELLGEQVAETADVEEKPDDGETQPVGPEDKVDLEVEAVLDEAAAAEETPEIVEPPRVRRSRAAIVVCDEPDSVLAALVLARDRRNIVSFRVVPQDGLMDFFKGSANDIPDNVDIVMVGFTAQPHAKDVLDTVELFRGRIQWLDNHEWPVEDAERMREVIGSDSLLIVDNASSPLAAVNQVTERRSRFTDKLLDASARRLSENDMVKWGYKFAGLTKSLAANPGEHRADIVPVLSGKPAEIVEAEAVYRAEEEWVEENDPRIVHFGEYEMAVARVPSQLDPGEIGRKLRNMTGARLSLSAREGDELLVLGCNDEKRPMNVTGLVEQMSSALPWAAPKSGGDRIGRVQVEDLDAHPERMEAVIGEIVRNRSMLYG